MPLPLMFLIPSIISTVFGGYNAYRGIEKSGIADSIIEDSQTLNQKEYKKYTNQTNKAKQSLDKLNITAENVVHGTIADLLVNLKFFSEIRYTKQADHNFALPEDIVRNNNLDLKNHIQIFEAATDIYKAFSAGIASGSGTMLLTTTFAKASTGTAISTLNGAAATKATLASIGGGSLKAGGLGIVGGKVVLGATFAAPAILVGGLCINKHGEKKLTSAKTFESESQIFRANLRKESEYVKSIVLIIRERIRQIEKIETRLVGLNKDLTALRERITLTKENNQDKQIFSLLSDSDYHLIQNCVMLARSLKEIISLPLDIKALSPKQDGCIKK